MVKKNSTTLKFGTLADLAELIGVSTRRAKQLVDEGVIADYPRGQVPLEECAEQYRNFVGMDGRGGHNRKNTAPVAEVRARRMEADAKMRELTYLRSARALVEAEPLKLAWSQAGASVRERLLQAAERIGTQLAPYIAAEHEMAVRAIVEQEIEVALTTLSTRVPGE